MGGSYKQCAECRGRALSIATRCPGCGREFPAREEADGGGGRKPGRSLSPSVPVVVLAGLGIVVASQVGRAAFPREQRSSLGAALTAPGPAEVGAAGSETGTAVAPESASPDSVPASAAAADDPPATAVLVAHRTIHLRSARSRRAALEAVLEPGDTLALDSLVGNWYRVTFEGEVMGYVAWSGIEGRAARGQ